MTAGTSIKLVSVLALVCLVGCGEKTAGQGADAGTDDGDAGAKVEPDYARLFPTERVLEIDLAITDADWSTLMADPLEDIYVPATLTFDGIVLDVGVRLKGNSSRSSVAREGGVRYSFKVDIDRYVDGQELLGIDKLNLNNSFRDPTYMRERLALDLFRKRGVPASRHGFADVSINGELFGFYAVIEQVGKEFLSANFDDNDGNLYKPELQSGSLVWRGDSISDYPDLELKTNEDNPDHTRIIEFLDVLNNTSDEQFAAAIAGIFDVDTFLRWLAANTAMVVLDSYVGSPHNYYLYDDPSTGKFVYVPWDTNGAYGVHACGGPTSLSALQMIELPHAAPVCGAMASRPLVDRILGVADYYAAYRGYVVDLLATDWTVAGVGSAVDSWATLIRSHVAADPNAFYSATQFETNLSDDIVDGNKLIFGLKGFTELRMQFMQSELAD